jgi:hypothetical protein
VVIHEKHHNVLQYKESKSPGNVDVYRAIAGWVFGGTQRFRCQGKSGRPKCRYTRVVRVCVCVCVCVYCTRVMCTVRETIDGDVYRTVKPNTSESICIAPPLPVHARTAAEEKEKEKSTFVRVYVHARFRGKSYKSNERIKRANVVLYTIGGTRGDCVRVGGGSAKTDVNYCS